MSERDLARPWWLLPSGRVHPLWWAPATIALVWIDYVTGANFQFPAAFAVPICIAGWYSGGRAAIPMAIVLPTMHGIFGLLGHDTGPLHGVAATLTSIAIRAVGFGFLGLIFARTAAHERALAERVQVLEGLLPICAFCKSIRDERGNWERFEVYITDRSEADFSHTFCPACAKEHYGMEP